MSGNRWMDNTILIILMMLHGDQEWWDNNTFHGMHGSQEHNTLAKLFHWLPSQIMQEIFGERELLPIQTLYLVRLFREETSECLIQTIPLLVCCLTPAHIRILCTPVDLLN